MPDNRKQHVVPRFYLAYFTDAAGMVHVWDRCSGKVFAGNPKNLGIESNCYTVNEDGVRDMSADNVNTAVESLCGPLLETLAASAPPDEDQVRAISLLMANLLTRSRHVRDQSKRQLDSLMEKLGKNEGWDFLSQLDPALADAEEALQRASGVSHAAVVGAGLKPVLDEVAGKARHLLVAPPGKRFVTSDDPVLVIQNNKPITLSLAPGCLRQDSISVFLPLKQDLACWWGNDENRFTQPLSVNSIARLNSMTIERAYRQVFSADPSVFSN